MDANKELHTLTSVIDCFSELDDPRVEGRTLHKLIDIIVITICAVACGAETWSGIEAFGYAKQAWLKGFLELPHDIPSDQTFARVFSLIPAEAFLECFMRWVNWSRLKTQEEIVAIDGKTLRGSHHHRMGKKAIHIVNAFATANSLVIGQQKVDDKSNEIKAIPPLLKKLELTGCIVTIDAIGCQKGIANLIQLQKADYVLAVKANQGQLHKKIIHLFEEAEKQKFNAMVFKEEKQVDGDHGRIEQRTYTILPLMYLFAFKRIWKGLQNFIKVESHVYQNNNRFSTSIRYYISSLPWKKTNKIIDAIRHHWHVENRLHWCLDVIFREDSCRIRKGYADQNFALLRKLVLNLLRRDKTFRAGLHIKRSYAAWNQDYLQQVVGL